MAFLTTRTPGQALSARGGGGDTEAGLLGRHRKEQVGNRDGQMLREVLGYGYGIPLNGGRGSSGEVPPPTSE